MNEYWDTSTDAALIAQRLETIADHLKRLVELLEVLSTHSHGSAS